MSKDFEIATKEGRFTIKKYKKGVEIAHYEGEDIYLEIPGVVRLPDGSGDGSGSEELPVISIGKKAMLSCKNLRSVRLPETIEEVSDWAFSYCDGLRGIRLPKKTIRFGKGVFRECVKLREITVERNHPDIGGLLAASVTLLDAPYLFDIVRSGDVDWLGQWDTRMLQILRTPDQDGYSKMVLCGEEDYGSKENNLDYFLNQKRKSKVRIAFMRLLNPLGLEEETKKELEEYLCGHTAGCESDETWQVLHEEHAEDSSYYKLFTEIGCLTEYNFDRILSDTGNGYPEMKAWFLKYKEEKIGYSDFFDDLFQLGAE